MNIQRNIIRNLILQNAKLKNAYIKIDSELSNKDLW